jgi:beta-glucosidase
MEGGTALARLLFGDVNPSGKLPFTVPKLERDLPPFNSFDSAVDYDYYHGYTLFDKRNVVGDNTNNGSIDIHLRPAQSSGTPPPAEDKQPDYPFGFGLSYTQFLLSDLKVNVLAEPKDPAKTSVSETCQVWVKVKNTGTRAGAEVVQLYIGFPESKIDRPVKLLRAFSKVFLEPGEERVVNFAVPVKDLAYYNPETKTWLVEKGKYEVMIGNSSRDEKMVRAGYEVK